MSLELRPASLILEGRAKSSSFTSGTSSGSFSTCLWPREKRRLVGRPSILRNLTGAHILTTST